MAKRRIIYVGGLAEVEALQPKYAGRLAPQNDYVFGRYCDATTEADLLWFDVHRCFTRARLSKKQRYACEEYIRLIPIAEIARTMGIAESTARTHIERGMAKLDALGNQGLGCMTTLIESCGGWGALRGYVEDIE